MKSMNRERLQQGWVSVWILVGSILFNPSTQADNGTLRVFILAGQSNMEGQGVVDLDHPQHYNGGKGTLVHAMTHAKDSTLYAHVKDDNGHWVERDDVFVRYRTTREFKKGKLGIGYGAYPGKHHIGPEYQLGHMVGDAFKEPVLLIKTAWGGKSLYRDFRPPGAGGDVGEYYQKLLEEVQEALLAMPTEFPALAGMKPEIQGFVWFQGWNDLFDEQARTEYADNLIHLVNDLRKAWEIPDLPVVIGELGNGGPKANQNMRTIREAQKEAAARIQPEGSAVFVETTAFARPREHSPNVGHGHHWFGNAESYFLIGDALGKALVTLLKTR